MTERVGEERLVCDCRNEPEILTAMTEAREKRREKERGKQEQGKLRTKLFTWRSIG